MPLYPDHGASYIYGEADSEDNGAEEYPIRGNTEIEPCHIHISLSIIGDKYTATGVKKLLIFL